MKITNTLTGTKEEFQPLGDVVKMYVCGITPYAESHVGHAMSYIIFDTVIRFLRYRGLGVQHVQNFTDIDDKIIARAQRLNVAPRDLAERYIVEFYDNMAALNVQPADRYVRATEVIPKIIEVIEGLIAKNYAYPVEGDVYFRVTRDDDYGKLSHRGQDELQAGARIEIDPRKESPMDFALWKAAKPGEPSWESPWGAGRPGWHIECSAIILQHLGDQIDIHGGGQDLIFPHHENEIAQSESCTGHSPFVRYWLHNGLLQLGEQKMSKSLGNLVTIREALAAHSADALRHFVLTSHYRSPLTYTDEALDAAERGLDRLRSALDGYDPSIPPAPHLALVSAARAAKERFVAVMDDDFNSPAALAVLFDLAREINRARDGGASAAELATGQAMLQELARVLGFTLRAPTREVAAAPFIDLLIEIRRELRGAKQYALADQVRTRLADLGVALEDRPEGTIWKVTR